MNDRIKAFKMLIGQVTESLKANKEVLWAIQTFAKHELDTDFVINLKETIKGQTELLRRIKEDYQNERE